VVSVLDIGVHNFKFSDTEGIWSLRKNFGSNPIAKFQYPYTIGHDDKTDAIFSVCFTKCFRNKSESVSKMKILFFETKMFLFKKHLRNESVFESKRF